MCTKRSTRSPARTPFSAAALPLLGGAREQPGPVRVGYVPQRDHVDAIWPFTAEEVKNPPRLPTNKVIPMEINNFIV